MNPAGRSLIVIAHVLQLRECHGVRLRQLA
jgi:hypothetical protein